LIQSENCGLDVPAIAAGLANTNGFVGDFGFSGSLMATNQKP
jgi:hypothetical protein